MSAPNTASMRMTGSSQYFLRTRMNRHSSPMKSIMTPSELPGHRVRRRARWIALDPVGDGVPVPPKPERILAEQPAQEADGGDRRVEDQPHDHRTDAGLEKQSEFEPQTVEGPQRPWKDESSQKECAGDDQSPAARRPAPHQGSQAEEREEDRKDEPEGRVGWAVHPSVAA